MCDFFSCVSDGKGTVRHFSIGEVAEIMAQGNPKGYNFNSHTSFLHFLGEKGKNEDQWNKWEYNPDTATLRLDTLSAENDEPDVRAYLQQFFKAHHAAYVRNLFNQNSGRSNAGRSNAGDYNSGHSNAGDSNSGHSNAGDYNSGHSNAGHSNAGHYNAGHSNAGDYNAGHYNAGHANAGHANAGHSNAGDYNSTDYASGHFNTIATRTMFNEICTQQELDAVNLIDMGTWYNLIDWVPSAKMTATEKTKHPSHITTGGFLRQVTPKQAWKKCPASVLEQIQALPHFNAEVFRDISGIDVRKKGRKP